MKVLMFSTDQKVFDESSQVRARILEYGKLFEELHLVVYTKPGEKEAVIGNVHLWPTNNSFRLGYFFSALKLGKKILKNGNGWVISSQDPFETGWVAYQLKKAFHIPFQAQIHTDFLSPYFRRASLKNRARVLFAKWLVKRADRVRVVSERIRRSLAKLNPSLDRKTVVLPIFVDKNAVVLSQVDPAEMSGFIGKKFRILTVARRAPEKNLQLAGAIIADLRKKGYDVGWLTISDNPAAPYYKIADLFLLTSNYEGYGMAAVEAAAAGLPVVMTDVGVALGATFPVGGKKKAIEIITDLIEHPENRRQLVEKQNEFFKNWSTREQYLEQYKKALTF